jgi:hypothetical protein
MSRCLGRFERSKQILLHGTFSKRMNDPHSKNSHQIGFAVAAWIVVVLGLALPIPSFIELYQIPIGTMCRPMGQAAMMLLSGFGTPLLAICLGSFCWKGSRSARLGGIAAAILSLIPLPLYYFLFQWIVDSHHLLIEA